MRLSYDQKTLEFVSSNDIKNGGFTIPESVESIGERAFFGCTGLTKLTIPSSVKRIGESTFYGCAGLTELTLPESITNIGKRAFFGCIGLTKLTLPVSVTDIGDGAFAGCTGLTKLTLPESITNIDESAFSGCTGLTELTLPSSVKLIASFLFSGCTGLTKLTLPESVRNIGYSAFAACEALTKITLPESVTNIGERAFSGCISLTELAIPSSVTNIGEQAFYACEALTKITLPISIKKIDSKPFTYCDNLKLILIDAPNDEDFERIRGLLPPENKGLLIPPGLYKKIKEAQEKEFISVKPFGMYSFRAELPESLINLLEQWNGRLHDVIDRVPLPRLPEELQAYKQALQVELSRFEQEQQTLLVQIRKEEQETLAERQRLRAISKLQQVIKSTEESIAVSRKKPGFFESNTKNIAESVARIAVAKKLITWLDNDKTVSFTEEEVKLITPGSSIGIILRNNSIDSAALPHRVMKNP